MTDKKHAAEWFAQRAKDTPMLGARAMFKIAADALEKQIPKKAHISLHGTTDWNTKCRCPVCRHDVFGTLKYCGNCGQALDWTKD